MKSMNVLTFIGQIVGCRLFYLPKRRLKRGFRIVAVLTLLSFAKKVISYSILKHFLVNCVSWSCAVVLSNYGTADCKSMGCKRCMHWRT